MQTVQRLRPTFPQQWLELGVLALLTAVYGPLLVHWYNGWIFKTISTEHEYFSHGIIGLPYAAYIVWQQRQQWQRLPDSANPIGAILMVCGAWLYTTGLADFVNMSFPIVLIGVCLWLKGWAGLKLQGFPLLLTFLATPNEMPYIAGIFTLPLQRFIAGFVGFVLSQLGVSLQVQNITIYGSNPSPVEIAPYCAGLKMLFTSLYVGLMLLHWTGSWRSRRRVVLLLGATVMIGVLANVLRNTILTWIHHVMDIEWIFHWFHEGLGGDLFNAGMLLMVVLVLNRIEAWVPEAGQPPVLASTAGSSVEVSDRASTEAIDPAADQPDIKADTREN